MPLYIFLEVFSPYLDAATELYGRYLSTAYLLVDPAPAHP